MRKVIVFGLLAAGSPVALAQRVVRPNDAEAPVQVAPSSSSTPSAALSPEPVPSASAKASPRAPTPAARRAPAPVFKDDIDDAVPATSLPAALGTGGSEAITSRTLESNVFVLHVRPAKLAPGKLAEIVLEVFEVMDPPDPEYGERKPVTGETLVGHVEGIGRFLLHPIPGNAGGYGFHFTPTGPGSREIVFRRLDGREGMDVTFHVPVGEVPGKGTDIRDWSSPGPDCYQAVDTTPNKPAEEE